MCPGAPANSAAKSRNATRSNDAPQRGSRLRGGRICLIARINEFLGAARRMKVVTTWNIPLAVAVCPGGHRFGRCRLLVHPLFFIGIIAGAGRAVRPSIGDVEDIHAVSSFSRTCATNSGPCPAPLSAIGRTAGHGGGTARFRGGARSSCRGPETARTGRSSRRGLRCA